MRSQGFTPEVFDGRPVIGIATTRSELAACNAHLHRVGGWMTQEECAFAEGCMALSNGHGMTMGTASTMASMAEALGMQLPYSATWPAVDSRRYETPQRGGTGDA